MKASSSKNEHRLAEGDTVQRSPFHFRMATPRTPACSGER